MASALGPVDVLCRLLTTVHFSLSSFLYITVIWSPLLYGLHVALNGVNCSNIFETRAEISGSLFSLSGVHVSPALCGVTVQMVPSSYISDFLGAARRLTIPVGTPAC